jgi:hypothetical protein
MAELAGEPAKELLGVKILSHTQALDTMRHFEKTSVNINVLHPVVFTIINISGTDNTTNGLRY